MVVVEMEAAETQDRLRSNGECPREGQLSELRLYRPHRGQWPLHTSSARFRIATCGRRWGKTWAAVNESAAAAWNNPRSLTWWVAPVHHHTQIGWRLVNSGFRSVIRDVSRAEKRIEFKNESVICFRSAENWQNLVGEGLKFLVVDEAARVNQLAWQESLRPTLADTNGRALIVGTPKGKNWFYHMWSRGQDPAQPEYASWNFPTLSNPYIDPKEIEEARATLPVDVFRQEWEAVFLDRNAGVFRNIEACVRPYSYPIDPEDGGIYTGGLDLARLQDFTVLTILDQNKRLVYFDRFNKISWEAQYNRIIPVAKRYGAQIAVDSTGVGDPVFDRLEREGLMVTPYKFTNESKKRLIEGLAVSTERAEMTFPDIPELVNEMDIFEYEIGKQGLIRYNAPAGYHDDCVISLALASWMHGKAPTGDLAVWI